MLFSSLLLLRQHSAKCFSSKQALCFAANKRSFSSETSKLSALVEKDDDFLSLALEHAKLGLGKTYPNPAVGCVLVNQDTDEVIGAGFHPRAGYPHAEVFALLQASGQVQCGIEAARSVVDDSFPEDLSKLMETYSTSPESLFENSFEGVPVTAYVTLEPCCHYGKTPPCAESLAMSKVNRVVVGVRDPNPRVDGGGVQLLRDKGIEVDMAEGSIKEKCSDVVSGFFKRITPKEYEDFSWINGAKRSALRRLAGYEKTQDTLTQVNWTGKVKAKTEDEVDQLDLPFQWMERVDSLLWKHELVNLRLNKAVGKKKLALRLGRRVANELGAHVAQNVGHTTLLYRPGVPPVLDLDVLVENEKEDDGDDE